MIRQFPFFETPQGETVAVCGCEHRTVSKDGRIVCSKIAQGDNSVSASLCGSCPSHAVDCSHLRFSLLLSSPSPLIVRCNGHTEVWNNEPPHLRFHHAACALHVFPIHLPHACSTCPSRLPCRSAAESPPPVHATAAKILSFPIRQPVAASA